MALSARTTTNSSGSNNNTSNINTLDYSLNFSEESMDWETEFAGELSNIGVTTNPSKINSPSKEEGFEKQISHSNGI